MSGTPTRRIPVEGPLEPPSDVRVLDALHDNVIMRDAEDRIVFWNRAAERCYGWTREEATRRRTHDLLRTMFPVPLERIQAELEASGRWEGELTHARRDGSPIIVSSRWVRFQDASGALVTLEINNDVTAQKEAERSLRTRERQQGLVAEFGQAALASRDLAALKTLATELVARGLGIRHAKIAERRPGDPDLLVVAGTGWREGVVGHARVRADDSSQAGHTMATRAPVIIEDHRTERRFILPAFIEEHRIVSSASVALLVEGQPVGVLVAESTRERAFSEDDLRFLGALASTLSSALERDRAEQALHAANQRLERLVADLESLSRQLNASNADLAQFAYVASHDLQEPLRMVASYVKLLERRYKGKLDQDADEFIQFAAEGAARMQRLINDLLALSRVESRGDTLKPVLLATSLQRARDNLTFTIEESGARIEVGDLPAVLGDESQLTQLFQNLMGNALKFRGESPPVIRVSARREADEWVVSVADNGIGIAPEYFERVFIIFQRLHSRAKYEGTGIGLALCKKIVERHGGRIWVESTVGAGATFHFTFPLSETPP